MKFRVRSPCTRAPFAPRSSKFITPIDWLTSWAAEMLTFSAFARSIRTESAFDVLAVARRLKEAGKDVIELEIGDSPFPSSTSAIEAGIQAIRDDRCHYGPSAG